MIRIQRKNGINTVKIIMVAVMIMVDITNGEIIQSVIINPAGNNIS